MAEALLDDLGVLARRDQQRGVRVAQVVEAEGVLLGGEDFVDRGLEVPLVPVVLPDWFTRLRSAGRGEDRGRWAGVWRTVLAQEVGEEGRQGQRPSLAVLGRAGDQLAAEGGGAAVDGELRVGGGEV